ncbi:MAG TPA: Rnase Y domain-containing protein, partial [Candidatus Hydrogenedentes bacterium]|nr:Rnase Y domain-containing protein [Candidatus Hydrogenedentota bacterium]
MLMAILCGAGGLLAGSLLTLLIARIMRGGLISQAQTQAAQIITEAERQAAIIIRDGKSSAKEMEAAARERLDKEKQDFRREINEIERRLAAKEQSLDNRASALDKASTELATQERALANREKELEKEHARLAQLITEETRRLEKISGLTIEQAKKELFVRLENEVRRECSLELKRIEDELRENADKRAQWIIGEAIQRCATEHTAESTVSVVALPNDEMKGRIIGREGRNIRTLENITGVNVIIDDTPEAVVISGFDPVRREIARVTLERLVQDGRIHPSRIEEMVEKVTEEMNRTIKERGEQACLESGVHGLHPELIKLLGRLSFRTSYGQNVLRHSLEVCHLAGIMAAEMGLNIQEAKR